MGFANHIGGAIAERSGGTLADLMFLFLRESKRNLVSDETASVKDVAKDEVWDSKGSRP